MSKDSAHFKAEERKQVRPPLSIIVCDPTRSYLFLHLPTHVHCLLQRGMASCGLCARRLCAPNILLLLRQVQTAARIKKLLERRARLTTAELAMHTRCVLYLCLHRHFARLAVRGNCLQDIMHAAGPANHGCVCSSCRTPSLRAALGAAQCTKTCCAPSAR